MVDVSTQHFLDQKVLKVFKLVSSTSLNSLLNQYSRDG